MKRMYLVKREVVAESIEKALRSKGRIYEVIECEKLPEEKQNKVGFKK